MKKSMILAALLALATVQCASAWSTLGHKTVIKVAERHLTARAKANIAKYMPYDLATDAVWMDKHRNDEGIAYTGGWHGFTMYPEDCKYDPNFGSRPSKGDAIRAIQLADYNLSDYKRLTDSAVLMNLRMILHFVGDMHCPTHTHIPGPSTTKWKCTLGGKPQKSFHTVYDRMPETLYGKTADPADVAAQVDNLKGGKMKRVQAGSFYDWAQDSGRNCIVIYEWNPFHTTELNPDTVELSRELVNTQLRNAGYRLAYLLNKYFDK